MMKKITLLITVFLLLITPNLRGSGFDSLTVDNKFIAVGETWYTDYYTNYSVWTHRSFFEDENGGLHIAFLSNYELFYYTSNDDGDTWIGEQVITGYEGGIKYAVICANADGDPYIAMSVNPQYTYGNPTSVSFGMEFYIDAYFVYKVEGAWSVQNVYTHSANYGFRVSEIYTEGNTIKILGSRYGWYDYGGEIWETTRSAEGVWSPVNVLYDYNDTGVDHSVINVLSVLNENGEKDLVYCRAYNASGLPEIATIHFDGSTWESPVSLTTNLHNYVSWDMTVNSEGDVWIASFNNDPQPKVYLFSNLGEGVEISLDLSMMESINAIKIHYTPDLLNLMVYPTGSDSVHVYVSADLGETWGDVNYADRASMAGILVVTDQYSDHLPDFDFITISRVSNEIPYGPDSLFFGHVEVVNTTALGVNRFENIRPKLSFYPNPVMNEITVTYAVTVPTDLDLRIYNLQGKVVFKYIFHGDKGDSTIKLDIGFLEAGPYVLEVHEKGQDLDGLHKACQKLLKLPPK